MSHVNVRGSRGFSARWKDVAGVIARTPSRVFLGALELSSAEVVVGFIQVSVSRKGHDCEESRMKRVKNGAAVFGADSEIFRAWHSFIVTSIEKTGKKKRTTETQTEQYEGNRWGVSDV